MSFRITIIEAYLRRQTSQIAEMDPYLKFELNGKNCYKTNVKHGGGRNPKWNEKFSILYNPNKTNLRVIVMDENVLDEDDFIASATIDLQKYLTWVTNREQLIELKYKGKMEGKLKWKVHYDNSLNRKEEDAIDILLNGLHPDFQQHNNKQGHMKHNHIPKPSSKQMIKAPYYLEPDCDYQSYKEQVVKQNQIQIAKAVKAPQFPSQQRYFSPYPHKLPPIYDAPQKIPSIDEVQHQYLNDPSSNFECSKQKNGNANQYAHLFATEEKKGPILRNSSAPSINIKMNKFNPELNGKAKMPQPLQYKHQKKYSFLVGNMKIEAKIYSDVPMRLDEKKFKVHHY